MDDFRCSPPTPALKKTIFRLPWSLDFVHPPCLLSGAVSRFSPLGRRSVSRLARPPAVVRPGKLRWRLTPSVRPEKRPVRPYSSRAWLSQASSAATAPDASTLPRPPLLLAQLPCTDTHLRRMNVPGCRLPSPHVSLRHDQSDNEIWLPHVPACRPGSLGDAGDLGRAGYRRIGSIHGEINALAARPSHAK
jgi:hypothetical protein